MGQVLHGNAKTTHIVRAAIQRSTATITELADQYDLNPKTVMKWHNRISASGISRLLGPPGDKPKKHFKSYPIGYFHIDIAEVRIAEGKLHMFEAIDRVSEFTFVELHERATQHIAMEFA